jgi:hypothetical protein
MRAKDLKVGQQFKLKGQRKFRTVELVIKLNEYDHIKPLGRKVLIIHNGSKILALLKDVELLTPKEINDDLPF